MFHLYTHAFFKAMLFLGAGAVIHACHHEQDMWKMGGLARHMPVTFGTFAIGTLALIGMPGFSGFFSKEVILGVAYEHHTKALFWIGTITALLTAFYMTRLVIVAFFGKPRTEAAHHALEAPMVMVLPLIALAIATLLSPLTPIARLLQAMKYDHAASHHTVLFWSITALLLGVGSAVFLYRGKETDPLNIKLFARKFYWDEIYSVVVKVFQDALAWIVTGLERLTIGGLTLRLPAWIVGRAGAATRYLQSGSLQAYTFLFGLGLLMVIYVIVFMLPQRSH